MERLQSVQNVRPLGEQSSRCGRQTGGRLGLRGRNGVPVMPVPIVTMLIVPNAIADLGADGIVLLECLAHRACFPCYVETTSFRAAAPSHFQRWRGLSHHRRALRRLQTPRHAFPHTQDQQAVFFWGIDTACWFDYAMLCADD